MEHELFAVTLDDVIASIRARFEPIAHSKASASASPAHPTSRSTAIPIRSSASSPTSSRTAIRYTPSGGGVAVSWTSDQHRTQIAVLDTGAGIAPHDLDRVFDRFWRGEKALEIRRRQRSRAAIALALARRHGGTVTVASKPQAGSTFTLEIPRRPPSLPDGYGDRALGRRAVTALVLLARTCRGTGRSVRPFRRSGRSLRRRIVAIGVHVFRRPARRGPEQPFRGTRIHRAERPGESTAPSAAVRTRSRPTPAPTGTGSGGASCSISMRTKTPL